jgi:hypothetical protein
MAYNASRGFLRSFGISTAGYFMGFALADLIFTFISRGGF